MTYPVLTIDHVQRIRSIDRPHERTLVIESAGLGTVVIRLQTQSGDDALLTPAERCAVQRDTAAPTPNEKEPSLQARTFSEDVPTRRLGRPAGNPAPRSGGLPSFLLQTDKKPLAFDRTNVDFADLTEPEALFQYLKNNGG